MRKISKLIPILLVVSILITSCLNNSAETTENRLPDAQYLSGSTPSASYKEIEITDRDNLEKVISCEGYPINLGDEVGYRFNEPLPNSEETKDILAFFDNEGRETRRIDLSSCIDPLYVISSVGSDSEGNTILLCNDREVEEDPPFLLFLSSSGVLMDKKVSTDLPWDSYTDRILRNDDGSFYVWGMNECYYVNAKGSATEIATCNIVMIIAENEQVELLSVIEDASGCTLNITPMNGARLITEESCSIFFKDEVWNSASLLFNEGYYFATMSGIFAITTNSEKTEADKILSFSQAGVICSSAEMRRSIIVYSPDRILYTSVIDMGTKENPWLRETQAILLARSDVDLKESVTITVGGYGVSNDRILQLLIQKFNRQGNGVAIECIDYGALSETVDAAEDLMALDLLAGQAPDILYAIGQTLDSYADQEHALALDDFLESQAGTYQNSAESGEAPFFTNIIDITRRDGKLLQLIPWFTVSGLMGETANLDDGVALSMQKVQELQTSFPDPTFHVFANVSAQELLLYGVFTEFDRYVNLTTGDAFFETPNFLQTLDFARLYGSDTPSDEETLLGSGQLIFANIRTLGSATNFGYLYDRFDTPSTITGYPTVEGQTAICVPACVLSVNSSTAQADACMNFLAFLLSEESQQTALEAGVLPILRDPLIKQINELTTQPEEQPAMSVEASDAFLVMLGSIQSVSRLDPEIFAVVLEESAPYFAGQKSAEEISTVIQNRITLLLEERQ